MRGEAQLRTAMRSVTRALCPVAVRLLRAWFSSLSGKREKEEVWSMGGRGRDWLGCRCVDAYVMRVLKCARAYASAQRRERKGNLLKTD